jgi:beta-lactamase regulating signal transducer with metallopeptidase domain
MDKFIIYSIEIAISLALFYSAYWIFLKNETFFKLNRFYLLSSVLIALLTPLLNISIKEDSFITKNLILPIEQYEQSIIGNIDDKNISIKNEMIIPGSSENTENIMTTSVDHASNSNSNSEQATVLNSAERNNSDKKTNWLTIVLMIYFVGVALFLIRFIANFIWIFGYALRHEQQQIFGMKVIRFEKNISPFSFLNFIFISHKEYPEAELTKIISHEKVHIKQKHSIDLILFELLFVFQWFNPFVWFYKRAIKITHEYLADRGTLNSGVDLPSYQYSLLNQVLSENNFEIVSNYNLSIKKRIEMMMKKKSSKLSVLKLIVTLPLLIFLFSAFAFKTISSKKDAEHLSIGRNISITDTSIKKVDVPIEYLKLLEGEYVSTNDPNGTRKIIFTEAFGTLHGFDNGYSYKIIPVGDGKFINPDDRASLVFDTKDKNAISLLLFGRINLNKVKIVQESGKVLDRSLAFSLANVMLKDGIPAALSYYKITKDSSNYFFTVREMNMAGYELLQSGKTKEAAAIFKLNTEIFPNSFNTYDSYADALMVLGDKTQAMENYKKSVKLNPGSINSIKRLKELGVNTDTLIKKINIPIEYLKLLEGVYLSTNQPDWIRKITFVQEAGILIGNDNGYKYKLIAMGDGKFINPDDGESLVFDTKDKNAITLLLFGTINLKKVKISKETAVNLKEYSGIYLPEKKDSLIKPMEIRLDNGKLYRFIESESQTPNGKVELEFVTGNLFFYTDNSARSIEFIVDDKKEVTGGILRRPGGIYKLSKKK